MTSGACLITEVLVARVLRAARKERARMVRIDLAENTIEIDPNPGHGENPQLVKERLAELWEVGF